MDDWLLSNDGWCVIGIVCLAQIAGYLHWTEHGSTILIIKSMESVCEISLFTHAQCQRAGRALVSYQVKQLKVWRIIFEHMWALHLGCSLSFFFFFLKLLQNKCWTVGLFDGLTPGLWLVRGLSLSGEVMIGNISHGPGNHFESPGQLFRVYQYIDSWLSQLLHEHGLLV